MAGEKLTPAPNHLSNWMAPRRATMLTATNGDYGYIGGYIATRFGIVGLYRETGQHPMTLLSVVHQGREIRATWNRTFSDRYLKMLANRLAALAQGGRGDG